MYSKDLWSEQPDKNGCVDRLSDKGIGVHHTDPDTDDRYNSTVGINNLKSTLQKFSNARYSSIIIRKPPACMLMNTTVKDEEPPKHTSFVKNVTYENLDKLTHLNWSICSEIPNEYQILELMLPGISTYNITVSSTRNVINVKIIPNLFGSRCVTKSKLNLHTPLDITINLVDTIVVDRVERSNGELRIRLIPVTENSSVIYHTILE